MALGSMGEPVEIVKARSDKKEYRRIVLDNSLEVLLISDPETDKCAASMNVSVGFFSDPKDLEGLAHFLEHMLFFASEKYPLENSYSNFISENGGSTNAFTSSDHTNFYFDVNVDGFEEALDRFAQIFIKPLMSADATSREIKAVDSENQNNLLSDVHRIYQLDKHLSSTDHPFHKFGTGSWDTLEVRPKERGIDTREELLKFYKENYSANLMHLVVYAKDSLDKTQSLVQDVFQKIENTNKSYPYVPGEPCTAEHLQILVKAVPIKQGHKLSINWPVTPGLLYYKEGPLSYLSHLIAHEGEGSLFYCLKKLGWATGLWASESGISRLFSFFEVYIKLTDVGNDHVQEIVGLLFKYISLLHEKGACKWIFEELSAMSETDFHYQDNSQPIDYVVHIASNMQDYPPKDWLVESSLLLKFNPKIIETVLNELTPYNVRIFWISPKFEGHTNCTEPWYGTAYSTEKITGSTIEQWMKNAPLEDLHLPVPNLFIPDNLSLKTIPDKMSTPILLRKSPHSRLWYKPDTLFSTPKGYIILDFRCPNCRISPESTVLTGLFVRLVMDHLNEYAYYADIAGLGYSISSHFNGFKVRVYGYSQKMTILLEKVIDELLNFEVKPDRFSVIKELITKKYKNVKCQQPYQQAMYYCSLALQEQSWSWEDVLEVLPSLDVDSLARFYPLLLSRTFLECYVAGNIESNEAESMVQHIEDLFYKGPHPISRALFASEDLTTRIIELGQGIQYLYAAEGLNPSDENSAFLQYIQVGLDDYELYVRLLLFETIADQPAFDQLRSVEQLGYITSLSRMYDSGVRGLQFVVQSSIKDPKYVESRVRAFLDMFKSKLSEMSDEEFKKKVNALIDVKLEKFKNIWEETDFFWWEISNGTYKFDRVTKEVAALKQLTKIDLIKFFDEYVSISSPKRKALSVRVYGSSHSSEYKSEKEEPAEPDFVKIEDIFSFRRSRPVYPSFKGNFENKNF
ncbi:PREDICTED: insulin-degrading enzyme-like 1, peroxisomal [Ipomoea nil]|uniref:insulin-degrading enzyme-like 1, peroxisomal n=1 Tax=Ipomoea nil TaxID=35883 RepID=UPI000901F692|nr:PREDICTED: insulin-degrading enzyme-like 1, peroxisomal [Ipomoea nil]